VGLLAKFEYQYNRAGVFRLSNAFKYTTKGKVTVSVTYDYAFAYLRVCDTGESGREIALIELLIHERVRYRYSERQATTSFRAFSTSA
jgi:hypothetical protein